MKTLSVKLDEPLASWLHAEAKQTRRSRSTIVREALEERRSARRPAKKSLARALLDCGGTFKGPADLSTNPKHLEGFGQ